MLSTGFKQCPVDHSLFIPQLYYSFIALLIYVDDLVLDGNNLDMINKVKATLQHPFHIKDLGPLKYFFGLEVQETTQESTFANKNILFDILSMLDSWDANLLPPL